MLSRLLDPTHGTPRDGVFWLVLMAIISVQLLAFYSVCQQQVRKAQSRQTAAQEERVALQQCLQSGANSTIASCIRRSSAVTPAQVLGDSGAVPASYVLR